MENPNVISEKITFKRTTNTALPTEMKEVQMHRVSGLKFSAQTVGHKRQKLSARPPS